MTQHIDTQVQGALRRSDPVLVRSLQVMTLCGVALGMLLYGWIALRSDNEMNRRGLAEAAAAGLVAAEAEIARIEAIADRTAPLIVAALDEARAPASRRATRAEVAEILLHTPVAGIAVLDGQGGIVAVFGQIPADAMGGLSPPSTSRRAGRELFVLQLVPVSGGRAAYYRDIGYADGERLHAAYVLRTSAFGPALEAGSASGVGRRAALLNPDGVVVLARGPDGLAFTPADAALAAKAAGFQPLHGEEAPAIARVSASVEARLVEARPVAAGRLHLVYLGDQYALGPVIASRKFEFLALFGASMLALVVTLSLIQNEWRRDDREADDNFLVMAQARTSCDLLDAGVIDWSVSDGRITYSDGWADMFTRGVKPAAEEVFEWIVRIHPEDQEAARNSYQSLLDGDADDIEHHIRVRLPSGMWAPVLERGRTIKGADGKLARIVLVQTSEATDGSALKEFVQHYTSGKPAYPGSERIDIMVQGS